VVPALLGQSISTPVQRALDNALSEAGLGQRVIPTQAGQGELSQALSARPTGLSSLSNDLSAAMQLAAVTGKTALANRLETALTPSLDMNKGQPLASVTPSGISSTVDDVSGLLSGMQRLNGTASSGLMPTLPVSTPVGHTGWANELGQRVSWLAQGEMREAQLQLNPRSLGPVDVRIAYGHDQQLNVSFSAANPVAREALDAALPRLREMFDQQGLNLAGANISQQSFSGQHGQKGGEASSSNPGQWFAEADDLSTHALLPNSRLMGDGMLDAYA
jgi:flagellar hook-length control protein FliK